MFYVKKHVSRGDVVVACCDKELLGKVFADGELEITVSERFYGGEVVDAMQLSNHFKEGTIVNILGDRVVDYAVSEGFVSEESVKTVAGVKHAQIITLN